MTHVLVTLFHDAAIQDVNLRSSVLDFPSRQDAENHVKLIIAQGFASFQVPSSTDANGNTLCAILVPLHHIAEWLIYERATDQGCTGQP